MGSLSGVGAVNGSARRTDYGPCRPSWNARDVQPFRRRLPYLPDTDVAKWYALAQAAGKGRQDRR